MERFPKIQHPERTEIFSSSFGEKVGVEMKNVNDLTNWLIFGNDHHFYSKKPNV